MASTSVARSDVAKRLFELQCCARCVLRYAGVRSASLYAKPYQAVVEHVKTEYNSGPIVGEVNDLCITCLGLLQQKSETDFVKQICQRTKASQWEYNSFAMAVYSPVVLLFRNHSLWLYLTENFSSIYPSKISADNILSVKEVMKYVYGPRMEEDLDVKFNRKSSFRVDVTISHEESMKELNFLSQTRKRLRCHPSKRRKVLESEPAITQSQVLRCIETLKTTEEFKRVGHCPPEVVENACEIISIVCTNESVYLAGRYTKYSRVLSQTPWILNNERKTESSVQELISEDIKKIFKPDNIKFSSAGREDVDVRMLGKGRPFILELFNPQKMTFTMEEAKTLQKRINESTSNIQVHDLQKVTREETTILKNAEESKTKSYSALVYVPGGVTQEQIKLLDDMKNVKLMQKTPLRVLHRRPLATRERKILTMSTEFVDENHFKLRMCAEAGTYIKEFVHGDFGRTKPNLEIIMKTETDILELDVESVNVDWPPYVHDQEDMIQKDQPTTTL